MAARGDRPPSDQSFAENAIILEALERDPDHVLRVLAQIAERLKADGRYTAEEVEAAAMYLCRSSQRELTASNSGAGRTLQLWESHALLLRARSQPSAWAPRVVTCPTGIRPRIARRSVESADQESELRGRALRRPAAPLGRLPPGPVRSIRRFAIVARSCEMTNSML